MPRKDGALEALLHRSDPSEFHQFLAQPCVYMVTQLYKWRCTIPSKPLNLVIVVCVSDTHNNQISDLPYGEILIHAGDITQSGTLEELNASLAWIKSLPHPIKIMIAGNHDIVLDSSKTQSASPATIEWCDIIYLNSSSTSVTCTNGCRLNIYGSPLTPRNGNWAFQYPRNQDIWRNKIPADTDILITHGPPKGHLDLGQGCKYLLAEMWRRGPRLHVFGHIHSGHGVELARFDRLQSAYEDSIVKGGGLLNLGKAVWHFLATYFWFRTVEQAKARFVNAAMVEGLRNEPTRRPIVVEM